MKIGVSGASGHLGRSVVSELLQRADGHEVVAITRTPEPVSRPAQGRFGDYDRPESLVKAYADLDRLLIITTVAPEPGKRGAQNVAAIVELDLAAEMTPEDRLVDVAPGELDTSRLHLLRSPSLRNREDVGEEEIGHECRRHLISKDPLEAEASFAVSTIDPDLLGATETLVTYELLEPLAERRRV
jgi:hypothetical protein